VDGVVGEQDRDVQPGLLDRDVLQVVDLGRVDEAEHAAHAGLRVRVGDLAVGEQLDLLELLAGGHLREQGVDPGLDAPARRTAGRREGRLVLGGQCAR
jgi:hypothetical protein